MRCEHQHLTAQVLGAVRCLCIFVGRFDHWQRLFTFRFAKTFRITSLTTNKIEISEFQPCKKTYLHMIGAVFFGRPIHQLHVLATKLDRQTKGLMAPCTHPTVVCGSPNEAVGPHACRRSCTI